MSAGYVDLHCHYLPAIDDGVKTLEEGIELCQGLKEIGYRRVVATPHIRTAMFDNRKPGLEQAMSDFQAQTAAVEGMPELGLGAEHFFDDVFWELFHSDQAVPYPGGHAALVEFSTEFLPRGAAEHFFEMRIKGVRPVIAHPERYRQLFKRSDELDPMLEVGALALLDLMSLVGKYGRGPKRAAERMLEEGVYYAACSDSHRPRHVPLVAEAIERLQKLVGPEEAEELLATNPQQILDGTAED